jgi:drug/metabolite transporter (DMT)-like permease
VKSNGARLGLSCGFAAAVAFGAGAPFAKLLLADVGPQLLAGLLYLGAFLALAAVVPFRRRATESPIRRADLPRLALLTLTGGVLAPVLLLVGLERVSGATGSLLLNLEGPFTVSIGLVVFAEHLPRRAASGAAAVFAGGVLLSLGGVGGSIDALGVTCIALACGLWGVDNNITQSLTIRDPHAIVRVKTGVAAAANIAIALVLGAGMPAVMLVVAALGLGVVAYGASILLDAYALRLLGAARESGVFATAPFVGAVLAVPMLSEHLTPLELAAGAVMAVGVVLLLGDRHVHQHVHEPLVHEHSHVHDAHHAHTHGEDATAGERHSHLHTHDRLVHAHPHVSDLHHRHRH